ncbi:hypothetical protein BJY00DRAFT_278649 [Aspergillus carlsbadensis]|nr:hypothetical protein BJY00DRAFT_278649 [Aspergillus carlsbadensis]
MYMSIRRPTLYPQPSRARTTLDNGSSMQRRECSSGQRVRPQTHGPHATDVPVR